MAIGRSIRPHVILDGTVERTRELRKKKDNSVYGHEIVLKQQHDAVAAFTIYQGNGAPPVPAVGEYVAVEASVEESRDFGTSLAFEKFAFDALDRMHTAFNASKKAA